MLMPWLRLVQRQRIDLWPRIIRGGHHQTTAHPHGHLNANPFPTDISLFRGIAKDKFRIKFRDIMIALSFLVHPLLEHLSIYL